MKIAYMIDSSSFLSENEANDYGFMFVPLHCIIENNDYLEGRNLDLNYLIYSITNKKAISTSQPSPMEIEDYVKKLKKEGYDCAIFSAMGSGLSNTLNNVVSIAHTLKFKIYPIDSCCVGILQSKPLLKVRRLIEKEGLNIEDALAIVNEDISKAKTYLVADDLFHLSRGGRLTKTAAALGSMLKIKPVLELDIQQQGKIDVVEKIRSSKKAIKKMAHLALDNIDAEQYHFCVAHFEGHELAKCLRDEMLKINPKLSIKEYSLGSVIAVHTGLNAVGVQVMPR
ncbi:MAG: DegV family protein [Bacilli bacterium]|jgi:DegV family protein with EDD domain|nr:DegV family protein [Bacilli bacterium]